MGSNPIVGFMEENETNKRDPTIKDVADYLRALAGWLEDGSIRRGSIAFSTIGIPDGLCEFDSVAHDDETMTVCHCWWVHPHGILGHRMKNGD